MKFMNLTISKRRKLFIKIFGQLEKNIFSKAIENKEENGLKYIVKI